MCIDFAWKRKTEKKNIGLWSLVLFAKYFQFSPPVATWHDSPFLPPLSHR